MGFDTEWALEGAMRGGCGSLFPRGYRSEKRPCPACGDGKAGRRTGMIDHMKAVHGIKRDAAIALIEQHEITWSSEEEIRALTP